MAKGTSRTRSERGRKGEVRGACAAPGSPPFGAEWRDERDLYVRLDGTIDEAAKRRLREWRQRQLTWNRYGSDGRIQVACDPSQPDRPLRTTEASASMSRQNGGDDMQRHIELERRLRHGPFLGDGSHDKPQLRFPLTRAEFRELIDLRKLHGCGEEWGEGEMRTYWRPDCDDNIVGRARHLLPRYVLNGRALV